MTYIKFNGKKFNKESIYKFNNDNISVIKLYSGSDPDQVVRDISFLNEKHQNKLQQICFDFTKDIFDLDAIIQIIEEVKNEIKENKS